MANKRPPTGAPNAEAMPAAAPAEIKFRRSSELRKRAKNGRVHSNVADLNCDMPAATRLPRWIMGPSYPTGMPQPTANAHDKNLTISVCILKMSLIRVPLRKPIISGMPEPAAAGWYSTNMELDTRNISE